MTATTSPPDIGAASASDAAEDRRRLDPGVIEVQGRRFIITGKTTGRQDGYVVSLLEQAGLEQLQNQMDENGDLSELATKVVASAYRNDTLYDIVGAMLTEIDAQGNPLPVRDEKGRPVKWSRVKAKELSDFVAELDEEEDKAKFQSILVGVLVLFFTTGAASLVTSPSSSRAVPQEQQASIATPRPDGSSAPAGDADLAKLLASGVLDPSFTATGTNPSASSPATTPTSASASTTGSSPTSSSPSSSD
jgi:hypothetical protein